MKRTLCLAASCLSLILSARADLDLDANGLGDVWETKYKPAVLTPGADDDHDGRTNLEECEAGTDPFSAEDIFAIREIRAEGANLVLSWPSQAGKRYQLQTTATPEAPASWQPIPGIHAGTGGTLEVSTPLPSAIRSFYRVVAADVDSDNDGLTDWEELAAGFDPLADHQTSCGCGEDCNCADCHCGGTELERLTAALQATPVVSIGVSDEDATEPPVSPTGIVLVDSASFKIKRRAGIAPVVVNLSTGGTASATDYQAIPSILVIPMGVKEVLVSVNPLADSLAESDESVTMTVGAGPNYTLGTTTSASVLIHDRVQANGTGLTATFWKHPENVIDRPYLPPAPTAVPPVPPEAAPTISRIDATVNYNNTVAAWPGAPITSGTTSNYFSSRWTGEIAPEFSQAYTIYFNANESSRVMLNGLVLWNRWPAKPVPANANAIWDEWPNRVVNSQGEASAIVQLEAGKRYPIVIEHYQNTGGHVAILSWSSQSQAKQVIPTTRMFPNTAPRILAPYEALAFVGDPAGFQYQINASGWPTSYSASNLPAGLTLGANGLISGTLTTPGTWHILLTATNANGSGSAFLDLTVLGTSGGITRELWTGVPGNSVSQIPLTAPNPATSVLTSLQAPSNAGDDYGVRIRGFITAPVAGDYKFYLRADEAAEFYLSDDEEPVNAWKRAELTAPVTAADWSGAAQSPLLRLEAGKRYYVELRHKEGTGDDHLALGWVRPDQAEGSTPTVIPGHLLTKYEDVALGTSNDGTLYFTSLTPQPGAVTNAYGSCLLRLSTDKKTAWVTPNYTGLGSDFFAMHVHDTRLPSTANIVFDLDEPGVEILADGTRVWHITDVASLTAEQIADGLSQYAYLNVHSVMYQNGEIKGFFKPLNGSSSFTAPPASPDWTTEAAAANTSASGAARMLQQATFGASSADIAALQGAASFDAWINAEFAKPVTKHLPYVEQLRVMNDPINRDLVGDYTFNSWWKNSITADDQLRQRVAFALSEIMVVSENGPLDDRADALSDYYDTLLENAFGNARSLLEAVTLHPAMGRYLDMLRNDKPSLTAGRIPNENYAREILQLFSLGLYRVHPDGSLILNSKGVPIPTYGQDDIIGMAHVFTGWDYNYTGAYRTSFGAAGNWVDPMREVPSRHYTGRKRVLNNVVLPGLTSAGGAALDPNATPSAAAQADPAFQALPAQELAAVHDQIFNHPNFGPFLCRQLIQRLVTSTPSRGYIYRVASKFNDNGSGVRGDMKTVIKAILLDYEARSAVAANATGYGKQREPVIRVTQFARAFRPTTSIGGTYTQDGGVITVDTSPVQHGMVSGQTIELAFSGPSAQSTDGSYSLSGTFPPTLTTFNVRTKDVFRGNWAQSGSVITVTTPSEHPFTVGEPVYLRFRSGGAGVLADGVYPVATRVSTTVFTVAAPDSATRSGAYDAAWLAGSFTQSYDASATPPTTTLTAYFTTRPSLAVDDKVQIQFTPETAGNPVPPAGTYTVVSVPDAQPPRVTLKPDSEVQSTLNGVIGTFHAAALAPVLNRGGTPADLASSGFSNWTVNGTDTDLGQTPLRASTVFNFYEPDYQFPGTLAANGLITPEFQISSDTNVLRQANFLFGGIFSNATAVNTGNTNGFNTFRRGEGDIGIHFGTWMGPRTSGTDYWTNDANLRPLIQEFSKILMAGQMSQAMEDQIYSFVSNTSNIAYNATNPAAAERRERVRGILHLIAVSPELAIQR